MRPVVSVITPTKNRLAFLCQTIDSVQAQTLADWEHIIVDDGSDDGTLEEVERRAASDPRLRFIRRSGSASGANVCRNLGLAAARAPLIVFLDSDDLLAPRCLEARVEFMRRNADIDFAVYRADVFSKTLGDMGRIYHPQRPGDDLLRFLCHECIWQTTGPVWRREFLLKIGGFDEGLLSMQDLEMHVRAICAGGKYVFTGELDHEIRWLEDENKTSTRHFHDPVYIEALEHICKKLRTTVESSGLMTWSRQRALVGLSFGIAESWARRRRWLSKSISVWNRGCQQLPVPAHLHLTGFAMLCVCRLSSGEGSFLDRLVNKWKGWVRFRQEPSLKQNAAASARGN